MRRISQFAGQLRQIATMAGRVHRVTMFKLPKAEDQQVMIKEYEKLWASATKKASSLKEDTGNPVVSDTA